MCVLRRAEATKNFTAPSSEVCQTELCNYNVKCSPPGVSSTPHVMRVRPTSAVPQPSIMELEKYVRKKVRAHVRYAADVDGRRPPASTVTHLIEYVLRSAVRHRWDVGDLGRCAARIDAMMFGEHSELIEMADVSGFAFVEDATIGENEGLSSSSDVVRTEGAKSELATQQPAVPFYIRDQHPSDLKEIAASQYSISDTLLGHTSVPQGPHYLTVMKPPLNLPLRMAEWQ